jgi:hypothetical protein
MGRIYIMLHHLKLECPAHSNTVQLGNVQSFVSDSEQPRPIVGKPLLCTEQCEYGKGQLAMLAHFNPCHGMPRALRHDALVISSTELSILVSRAEMNASAITTDSPSSSNANHFYILIHGARQRALLPEIPIPSIMKYAFCTSLVVAQSPSSYTSRSMHGHYVFQTRAYRVTPYSFVERAQALSSGRAQSR